MSSSAVGIPTIRPLRDSLMIFSMLVTGLLVGLAFLFLASGASAHPVWGDAYTLEQPDGTEVEVRIWGDEFYRVVESADGYTLVRDPETGVICYAEVSADGWELESTGVRFDTTAATGLSLDKHLRIDPEAARAEVARVKAQHDDQELAVTQALAQRGVRTEPNTIGEVVGITLIIDFDDEVGTIPPANVDDYCNQIGYGGYGNAGSVRDYFSDVSDGLLDYTNFVPAAYYRANLDKSYYDDCDAQYGTRARQLILEALNDLDDQGFDFSLYDSNEDGIIDALNCFYAGNTQCGWAQGLWPHASSISFSADGVNTSRYQITGMGSSLTLSTFCHENGHMLCWWPDLYDYDGDSRGVGRFCIMCNSVSSISPQEPCAPLKHYANWGTVIDLDAYQTGLEVLSYENTYYKYTHPTHDYEYYMIENRQQAGRDAGIPDHGIAIWHVDELYGSNNNQQQTPSLHYEVTLVQADGDWDMENNFNSGDDTDLWAAPEYTECGPDTWPNTNWWDGSNSSMLIEDISESGTIMTYTFNPAGETHVPSQYATIQAAIDAADYGEIIVLWDGTYMGTGNRDLDFQGKVITIRSLSGDPASVVIDCAGTPGDPHRAFHFHSGEDATAIVENITISNGYAAGDGGAILCDGASPTLQNVIFSNNEAAGSGGALSVSAGDQPMVENCVFVDNIAATGGAVAINGTDMTLYQCTFYGNTAGDGGALACQGNASLLLTNSIIANTLAGDPVYCAGGGDSATLECCDLFGNLDGDWVGCIAGQDAGSGNFSGDPLFCEPLAGDFTIREGSPCVGGAHPEGPSMCGGENIGAHGIGCFAEIFTPVTSAPLADTGNGRGAAWGDYDGDGDQDLFIANYNQPDKLLRNDGSGVFTDVTTAPMNETGRSTGAAWADYDNDGDVDLYLARFNATNRLFRNEGGDVFVDIATPPIDDVGESMGVSWVDYDNDGLVDLYVVDESADNLIFKNYGGFGEEWFFFAMSEPVLNDGGTGSCASWGDYDNDGDQDAYIVNTGANVLGENGGTFGFFDITGGSTGNTGTGSGAVWGDYDNDGDLDIYLTNNGQEDVLLRNSGSGNFSTIIGDPLADNGSGTGVSWGDFDNDTKLDFFLGRDGEPDKLYWSHGEGAFSALGVPEGEGSSQSVTWCDYDGDGDLDVYVVRDGGANVLLQNDFENTNHWLHVKLQGDPSNRSAIGARVTVVAGGVTQIREVTGGSGFLSQNSLPLEFGLGAATIADEVTVDWPSGSQQVLTNVTVDRVLALVEGQNAVPDAAGLPLVFALHDNAPNPFNPATVIKYDLPQTSRVSLKIFDVAGRLVRQLRTGEHEEAGAHQAIWNGRDDGGRTMASGTYFYKLDAGTYSATKRMLLIK